MTKWWWYDSGLCAVKPAITYTASGLATACLFVRNEQDWGKGTNCWPAITRYESVCAGGETEKPMWSVELIIGRGEQGPPLSYGPCHHCPSLLITSHVIYNSSSFDLIMAFIAFPYKIIFTRNMSFTRRWSHNGINMSWGLELIVLFEVWKCDTVIAFSNVSWALF